MLGENVSQQVRQLIAENEPRQAATLLYESFKDKNEQLAKIALVQINHQKRLSDQVATGILSQSEINIEQAKINQALLYLADEHIRLFGGGQETPVADKKWLWRVALGVLGLLAIVLIFNWVIAEKPPATFDLEVRLHGPKGEQDVVQGGRANVRLGSDVPQAPQPLDANGKALFRKLSGEYLRDSVQLVYLPDNGLRYRVLRQSAATGAESRTIRFELAVVEDTTRLRLTLRDRKGPLANAQVTIDGKTVLVTDKNGYFEADIIKPSGGQVHLLVEKDGKRRFEQDITISPEFKTLPIQ